MEQNGDAPSREGLYWCNDRVVYLVRYGGELYCQLEREGPLSAVHVPGRTRWMPLERPRLPHVVRYKPGDPVEGSGGGAA